MIAWLTLAVLGGATVLLLWAMGIRGGLLTASMAALLLGAVGYAAQGDPEVASAGPAQRGPDDAIILTDARHAFFGDFGSGESWLRMSEALTRTGSKEDAVGILVNATKRSPGDAQLWIGLGNALVDQAGMITPPAELAYKRAGELAPGNPAGEFFYGLALARSGDPQRAVTLWRQVLAGSPPNAPWRPLVEQGIAALSGAQRPNGHAPAGS